MVLQLNILSSLITSKIYGLFVENKNYSKQCLSYLRAAPFIVCCTTLYWGSDAVFTIFRVKLEKNMG